MTVIDLAQADVRELNRTLQMAESGSFEVRHPGGAHALAAGLTRPIDVTIDGHAGY